MEGGTRRPVSFSRPPNWQNPKTDIPSIKMECPVCFEILLPPIVLCVKGHSLCKSCKDQLHEKVCPVCRAPMSDKRNEALETLILKSPVSCPNEKCAFKVKAESLEDHLKECLYRDFKCVIGAEFKNCLWSGKLSEMLAHFKEQHKGNCKFEKNTIHKLQNFITHRDNKVINLISVKSKLFIFTIKIDTRLGMAYWLIQFIGLASHAKKWVYDVTIFDSKDNDRKNIFTEVCQSDTKTCDEIFSSGKCVCMILTNMETYISNNVLTYSFNVRPISEDSTNPSPQPNFSNNSGRDTNAGPRHHFGPHNNAGPRHHFGPHNNAGQRNHLGPHNNAGPRHHFGPHNNAGPRHYSGPHNNTGPRHHFGPQNKPGPSNRSGPNNNPGAHSSHAGQSSRGGM